MCIRDSCNIVASSDDRECIRNDNYWDRPFRDRLNKDDPDSLYGGIHVGLVNVLDDGGAATITSCTGTAELQSGWTLHSGDSGETYWVHVDGRSQWHEPTPPECELVAGECPPGCDTTTRADDYCEERGSTVSYTHLTLPTTPYV